MTEMSSRKGPYKASVEKAMQWILSHQQADGSFGPVETMSHYMVLGAALLYTGHADAASRLMPALRRLFLKQDGSLDAPEIRAGRPSALLERGYAPSWIIYSSHLNHAYDISLRNMPYLLRLQDPKSGGMFGTQEHAAAGKGIVNAAVTCVAGQAALTTGYLREARSMGDHLVNNLLAHNPDLSKRFYPVWDTERGLRTDSDAPSAPNMPRVLQRFEPNQHHFLTGMMIAFLTDLHAVTNENKYLDAALEMYEFGAGGSPSIYENTLSHKFAWGCAWLYRQTQMPKCLESACLVCDYLVRSQEQEGSFVHWGLVKSAEEWPYSPRLNTTAQFALWISRTLNLL
jgi:hypothetical protein